MAFLLDGLHEVGTLFLLGVHVVYSTDMFSVLRIGFMQIYVKNETSLLLLY